MLSKEVSELGQGIRNMMFLLEELLSGRNTPAFCPAHSSDTYPAHVTWEDPPPARSCLQFQQDNAAHLIQGSTSVQTTQSVQCSARPRTVPSSQRPPQHQLVYSSSTLVGATQSSASVPGQCGLMQSVQCKFPQSTQTPTSRSPPAAPWTLPFRVGLAGSMRSHSLENTFVSCESKPSASLQRLRSLPQEVLLSPRDPKMERAPDS